MSTVASNLPSGSPSIEPAHDAEGAIAALRIERNAYMVAGDWPGAAGFATQIAALPTCTPEDLRIASGVLSQCGRMADALPFAIRASLAEPGNAEFAQHAGCVSNQCGDDRGAIDLLLKAASLDSENAETYQQLSLSADRLDDLAAATALAQRAYQLDPSNPHRAAVAAHYLAREQRLTEATAILRGVINTAGPSPAICRMLAHLLQVQADYAGALEAIDRAISADPDSAEYHAARAHALLELGRNDEADIALQRSLELDPANLGGLRHAVSILAEKDQFDRALSYGGRLLERQPDNAEFGNCMRHLLETQRINTAVSDFAEIAALKASAPARRAAPRTYSDGLANQFRIIMALVLRDLRGRHGHSHIGLLWILLEPIIHIGVLAVVFQFTMEGSPPMGDDFFLFYFTGVMPYLLLNHLVMRVGSAVRDSRGLMQVASITPMDLLMARSIVEFFITIVAFFIFIGLFELCGVDAASFAPQYVFGAFAITWMLGTGIGLVFATLHEFGGAIDSVLGVFMRIIYFVSGIFYVPALLPLFARDIFVWNPFLHVVDLMRIGFFRSYDPPWSDVPYAAEVSVVMLLLGLITVTATARPMRILR